MKKLIIIVMLVGSQMFPVMAKENEEERRIYEPRSEEVGGTIYGRVSGKALGDDKNYENEEQTGTDTSTGANTADNTLFLLWIVLFGGAYYVMRKKDVRNDTSS